MKKKEGQKIPICRLLHLFFFVVLKLVMPQLIYLFENGFISEVNEFFLSVACRIHQSTFCLKMSRDLKHLRLGMVRTLKTL